MKQGFYVDLTRCTGCRTCQVACKDKNDLDVGVLFRQVTTYESGVYPEARIFSYPSTCNHCENPECVNMCPTGAMYIDKEDGTTQHDDSICIGCGSCVNACPYGVPVIMDDNISHKCDACKQLRDNGESPACVAACTYRALEFGPIEELRASHPEAVDKIAVMPESGTSPSIAINPVSWALSGSHTLIIL